jgi:hypothetical protein
MQGPALPSEPEMRRFNRNALCSNLESIAVFDVGKHVYATCIGYGYMLPLCSHTSIPGYS